MGEIDKVDTAHKATRKRKAALLERHSKSRQRLLVKSRSLMPGGILRSVPAGHRRLVSLVPVVLDVVLEARVSNKDLPRSKLLRGAVIPRVRGLGSVHRVSDVFDLVAGGLNRIGAHVPIDALGAGRSGERSLVVVESKVAARVHSSLVQDALQVEGASDFRVDGNAGRTGFHVPDGYVRRRLLQRFQEVVRLSVLEEDRDAERSATRGFVEDLELERVYLAVHGVLRRSMEDVLKGF